MKRLVFTLALLCCSTSWGWKNSFGVEQDNSAYQLEQQTQIQEQQLQLQQQMVQQERERQYQESMRQADLDNARMNQRIDNIYQDMANRNRNRGY